VGELVDENVLGPELRRIANVIVIFIACYYLVAGCWQVVSHYQ
jgi:hypothetical protein